MTAYGNGECVKFISMKVWWLLPVYRGVYFRWARVIYKLIILLICLFYYKFKKVGKNIKAEIKTTQLMKSITPDNKKRSLLLRSKFLKPSF